jgi:hypothetical protein
MIPKEIIECANDGEVGKINSTHPFTPPRRGL